MIPLKIMIIAFVSSGVKTNLIIMLNFVSSPSHSIRYYRTSFSITLSVSTNYFHLFTENTIITVAVGARIISR